VVVVVCGLDIRYYVTNPNSRKGRNRVRSLRITMGAFAWPKSHWKRNNALLAFFAHYLINGTIFGKHLLKLKYVFSLAILLSKAFLILRRVQRDVTINVRRSSCEVLVVLFRFIWDLNFSPTDFRAMLNMKFYENPPCGIPGLHVEKQSRSIQIGKEKELIREVFWRTSR